MVLTIAIAFCGRAPAPMSESDSMLSHGEATDAWDAPNFAAGIAEIGDERLLACATIVSRGYARVHACYWRLVASELVDRRHPVRLARRSLHRGDFCVGAIRILRTECTAPFNLQAGGKRRLDHQARRRLLRLREWQLAQGHHHTGRKGALDNARRNQRHRRAAHREVARRCTRCSAGLERAQGSGLPRRLSQRKRHRGQRHRTASAAARQHSIAFRIVRRSRECSAEACVRTSIR